MSAQQELPQSTAGPQRDPRASAALQAALAALGGNVPASSTASGTVELVAGGATETGSIQIETKGMGQTLEQLSFENGVAKAVYSNGAASDTHHAAVHEPFSMELAATSHSVLFPLPYLAAISSSVDFSLEFVGSETLNDVICQHIKVWDTYASRPSMQFLLPFSYRDIWFSSATNLPVKIAYNSRSGAGAVADTKIDVSYSSYQTVSGVQFPLQIHKSINDSPWMNITISTVTFNAGLSDSDFQIF
jgi:hypothetical protein